MYEVKCFLTISMLNFILSLEGARAGISDKLLHYETQLCFVQVTCQIRIFSQYS